MRTFSCFTRSGGSAVPTLTFVLAADEHRARELARRELIDAGPEVVSVEIREHDKLLWVELPTSAAREGALDDPRQASARRRSRAAAWACRLRRITPPRVRKRIFRERRRNWLDLARGGGFEG